MKTIKRKEAIHIGAIIFMQSLSIWANKLFSDVYVRFHEMFQPNPLALRNISLAGLDLLKNLSSSLFIFYKQICIHIFFFLKNHLKPIYQAAIRFLNKIFSPFLWLFLFYFLFYLIGTINAQYFVNNILMLFSPSFRDLTRKKLLFLFRGKSTKKNLFKIKKKTWTLLLKKHYLKKVRILIYKNKYSSTSPHNFCIM